MDSITQFFHSLPYTAHYRDAVRLIISLGIGGAIGLFLRALYLRFGLAVTNRNSLSTNFPILIITTIVVIFVVKTSLALSLGLVGALSIVRFRAAIKEPEELVFLFFCIAVGLALGAEYPVLALAGVGMFTVFMLIRHRMSKNVSGETLLLTISGPASVVMGGGAGGDAAALTKMLTEVLGKFTLQRLEVQEGNVMLRAVVTPEEPGEVIRHVEQLRGRLPGCNLSWVNLSDLL